MGFVKLIIERDGHSNWITVAVDKVDEVTAFYRAAGFTVTKEF